MVSSSDSVALAENSIKSMAISGTQIGGTYHIFLAYVSWLCKGISPQNMPLYGTFTYLHVFGSWRSPIDFLRSPDDGCFFLKTWQIQQMCHGDHEEPTDLEWFHGDLSTNVGF
jgi:hypothetical protein